MTKYIDKDKVLAYIIFGVVGKDITCGELKRAIESFPAVEVSDDAISPVESERPKGEWVAIPYEIFGQGEIITDGYIWQCTNCGEAKERNNPDMNFCSNCGADMRGDKE